MRWTRRLFPVVIVILLAVVGAFYRALKRKQEASAPAQPAPLAANFQAQGLDWVHLKTDGDIPIWEARAREMGRVDQPTPRILLKQVQLKLFHKQGREFDLVKCEGAEFDEGAGTLYSEGAVEIVLAMPATGAPKGRLVSIRSSGVRVESATGKATTDKPTSFQYDLGDGSAVGAAYDPQARELNLLSNVVLHWRGTNPKAKPMTIEADALRHKEGEDKVYLGTTARLRRESLTVEGASAVATLDGGAIRFVEALSAKGTDRYPNRVLAFGADSLNVNLTAKSEIEKITGQGQAFLDVQGDAGQTNVKTDRIDLDFTVTAKESVLRRALATGHAVVNSRPAAKGGVVPAPTRVVRADVIEAKMRAGGEELEAMQTHSPGAIDLVPNHPSQPRRHMTAERMWMEFGDANRLKSFRGVKSATRTVKPRRPTSKTDPPPALTWSDDITAEFDSATGDIARLKQWNNFRYQEGEQQAVALEAILDSPRNLITLDRDSRAWDSSGSVTADRIFLHQQSGDFTAEGNVASSRLPDSKASSSSAMLNPREAVQATAKRMDSSGGNRKIVYTGDAVMWQSGNRLQAQRIAIDRDAQTLSAEGGVVSQFLDRSPEKSPLGTSARNKPAFTVVRAASLHYTDSERLALYRGGVRLVRDTMDVKSRDLRAWLRPTKSADSGEGESSLDRAFADGDVEIFQVESDRTRRSFADHAEYYTGEEKVVLSGGNPHVIDSVKGITRAAQLTYWANNDSLQGEGAETKPVVTRIRRK